MTVSGLDVTMYMYKDGNAEFHVGRGSGIGVQAEVALGSSFRSNTTLNTIKLCSPAR